MPSLAQILSSDAAKGQPSPFRVQTVTSADTKTVWIGVYAVPNATGGVPDTGHRVILADIDGTAYAIAWLKI